jgi:glycyl-tRNA synthetase beta chain
LNEFPSVLRGSFDPVFLEIPREVLVTVMRYHQKYFSLVDQEKRLAPAFLTVLNTDGDPEGTIRRGHEKVLQARLEDAAFFWEADQKTPLRDRLETLKHVLFQEKLGTYFEKTVRIRAICRELGGDPGLDDAAALCKVDLTTDMVRELTELQGIMGGLYAKQEGLPEGVWRGIYHHYRPVSLEDELPETLNGALLSIADRIDSIVGCFGVGIVPTGSSDPFALRRQAQGLITLLLARGMELPLGHLVDLALRNFSGFDDGEVKRTVIDFLQRRLIFILEREGLEPDVIRSVFAVGVTTATDARERARAVAAIKGNEDFSALAAAFKRAKNLLSKAGESAGEVDRAQFEEPGETLLFEAISGLAPQVKKAIDRGDYLGALRGIAGIRPAVDRFFEDVLVMAENPLVRRNRLALLGAVADMVLSVADPSEIVHQGGENER